ncbi:MAG: PAS domain S-box protein [Candidatus Vogelbacteria bacterium]|nr:PAS domain S-box protein [Candidatus Vogelbacteria bacterium]
MEKEKLREDKILIKYADAIVNTLRESLLVIDGNSKILFANTAFYNKFFVSEEETLYHELFSLGGGQWDIPKLRKLLDEVLPEEKSFDHYEITYEFPRIGTRIISLNARGLNYVSRPGVILLVIEDITERKAVEQRLGASEVRYRKLFETAKDGILLIDPVTEKIIDANPFLLSMLGYSLEEINGKKLWEIGAIRDIPATKKIFKTLQTTGYARYENLPVRSKDGSDHEVEFVSNLYGIDGTAMIQCNIRDITDRIVAEHRSEAANQQLRAANQQIDATNQQLRAANQQIDAANQQLRAANSQLSVAEGNLKDKVGDLEVFNQAAIGRELKMIEMKEELEKLRGQINQ